MQSEFKSSDPATVAVLQPGPNPIMRVLRALKDLPDERATQVFYSLHIVEHKHYKSPWGGPPAPDPKVVRATRPNFDLGERKTVCKEPGCQMRGLKINYYHPPMVLPPEGAWRSGYTNPAMQASVVYEDAECTMYM
jgi:hypothetical protein